MSRFGRFTAYLRPYRLRMAIAAGLIMAVAGINLGMLWIVRRLVDTVEELLPSDAFRIQDFAHNRRKYGRNLVEQWEKFNRC